MTNKTYDLIKLIIQIIAPAVITAVGVIGEAVQWDGTALCLTILGALTACAGTILKGVHDTYMADKEVVDRG